MWNKKILSIAINCAMSFMVGAILGFLLSAYALIELCENPAYVIFPSNANLFVFIVFLPILIGGALGVFLEIKKTGIKIIRFFQGRFIRKLWLLSFTILSIFCYLSIQVIVWKKYKAIGERMVSEVAASVKQDEYVAETKSSKGIKYILITEQYSLMEEDLLKTGKIGKKLARAIAAKSVSTEGTYLYLVGQDKVFVVVTFPRSFRVKERFHLTQAGDKIRFYVRRETKKDKFGKRFEEFVIYAVE